MRTFLKTLGWGLPVAVFALAMSCSDESIINPSGDANTTSTTSGGGDGGASSSTTTSSTGGAASSSGSGGAAAGTGGAGGGNMCAQACNYVEVTCGFTGACAALGVNCNDPASACPAQCILNATCAQIATLAGMNPDPVLSGCLQTCQASCQQCAQTNCSAQIAACQQDVVCQAYAQCASGCANMACNNTCLQNNNSAASQALVTCVCGSCSGNCAQCT